MILTSLRGQKMEVDNSQRLLSVYVNKWICFLTEFQRMIKFYLEIIFACLVFSPWQNIFMPVFLSQLYLFEKPIPHHDSLITLFQCRILIYPYDICLFFFLMNLSPSELSFLNKNSSLTKAILILFFLLSRKSKHDFSSRKSQKDRIQDVYLLIWI